ncbi:hypothetical protein [Tardiphaga sp. P9-11]|uniref:hypothetical protein n=1 Tax=Tardiphaga sp. P9-11 TaxID=2024614 RepID=UPI0011F2A521|nr:hypothetical protein [Tardiphaga sp. P9-11]KAA0074723.1 hypothetical protein CIW50_17695 [Tardiphaga sp. P9-11]
MRTATGARRLVPRDDDRTYVRWRLGTFIVLSCAGLLALAALASPPPAKSPILPTGPMPAVNIP